MKVTVHNVTRFCAHHTTTAVWAAYDERGYICGVLTIDKADDFIELVYVREGDRRQGIATTMLACARRETGLQLLHDRGDRSLEGSAWCRSHGIKTAQGYRRISSREAKGYGARLMFRLPMSTKLFAEWDEALESA